MYKKILIATDGSPSSNLAVKHGIKLAAHHGASVDVVYVTPHFSDNIDYYQIEELETSLVKEAEGYLGVAIEEAGKEGVTAVKHILTGEAEIEIVRFAEDIDADLIVMGSHGHKGFVKLLIGSVAERVIGMAHCPVLVMKHR